MDKAIHLLFMIAIASATTCYISKTTTNPYEFLDRVIVETQRGCEVLCDGNSTCAGFAFKENGFNSSCVLLKKREDPNKICSAPATMFLKTYTDCPVRSNITAEFGPDPCIDDMAPALVWNATGTNACTLEQRENKYIVRVVTADGKRKSFANTNRTMIVQSGDMWLILNTMRSTYNETIVAAACVSAGSTKCACGPQTALPYPNLRTATADQVNPCGVADASYLEQGVNPMYISGIRPDNYVNQAVITCKAAQWYRWEEETKSMITISGGACPNT